MAILATEYDFDTIFGEIWQFILGFLVFLKVIQKSWIFAKKWPISKEIMSILVVRSMYFYQKDKLITYYEVATMI